LTNASPLNTSIGDSVSVGDWPSRRVPVVTISSRNSSSVDSCAQIGPEVIATTDATAKDSNPVLWLGFIESPQLYAMTLA
jgi:hypothetical protein